jgi:predicted signal transduction protein with EAL and GGDEF domain
LAVLVAGPGIDTVEPLLAKALSAVPELLTLPGGATVKVDLAAGLASFPAHAGSVDELYMAADAALAVAVDEHAALRVAI